MAKAILGYRSKSELRQAIQGELAGYRLGEEFESPLLREVIGKLHYFCAPKGLVPLRFRKDRNTKFGKAYYFMALFQEIGWHGVSWTKCIDGRTLDHEIKAALRIAVRPLMDRHRQEHPVCERCGNNPSFEVDHVAPEFQVIAEAAMATLTSVDRDRLLRTFSWIDEETFTLPEDMACVQSVLDAHRTAKLMALCHACHVENARDRRRGGPPCR